MTIGRVEHVTFPGTGIENIPARIDTGARTSVIWASNIRVSKDGWLSFNMFDESSTYYKEHQFSTRVFSKLVVSSSMGTIQKRYKVKLPVIIKNRRINASFTLADRSQQVYPILIGRNVLRGKFVVDVKQGEALKEAERKKIERLQKMLNEDSE